MEAELQLVARYTNMPPRLLWHWYSGRLMEERHPLHKGWVYFIRNAEAPCVVKIGYSDAPAKRLSQLQTGNDCELYIAAVTPASGAHCERHAHKMLEAYCKRNEWFFLTGEVEELFAAAVSVDSKMPSGMSRALDSASPNTFLHEDS